MIKVCNLSAELPEAAPIQGNKVPLRGTKAGKLFFLPFPFLLGFDNENQHFYLTMISLIYTFVRSFQVLFGLVMSVNCLQLCL